MKEVKEAKESKREKDWIIDLETYPNCFTFCAVFCNGKGMRVFEISDRKDDTEEMLEFLRNMVRHQHRMVGFNNLAFDYPIIHYILQKARKAFKDDTTVSFTAKELYEVAQGIIDSMREGGFGKKVKDDEVIIPQVDLFKIHHFDNKAKATSLKTLEFNMRSDNIEDLPYPVGSILGDKEKDELIRYNKHDVLETLKFYNYSKEALELREELSGLYGFDCTNFNDTKIGKELFIQTLEKESPGSCYTKTERGRKINQTHRERIVIKDCLFPYIKFNRPEFKAVHEWFKKQIIKETNGVFSDLEESTLGDVAQYAEMVVKRKKFKSKPTESEIQQFNIEHPLGWIKEEELKATEYLFDESGNHVLYYPLDEFGNEDTTKKQKRARVQKKSYWGCWKVAETLNVVINGVRIDFGVGGIHAAKQGVVKPEEGYRLMTYDVASYYPNMAIANEVYPKHLGKTFCKVYKDLYEQRKSHPKGSAANSALKLALNGVYGDSGNEFSPLYDPAYTMAITIGGQLSLCMLTENLIDRCNAEIVMMNTDGEEFLVREDFVEEAKKCISEWEQTTGLQMEGDEYSAMYIANVNNYISVTTKGKVKLKGAFEHAEFDKLGWHKNHSSLVIPKAVEAYFVKGEDPEEFIRLHKDKWDFMLRTKVPRSSRLVLVDDEGNEEQQQNNCRYYPVKEGGGYLIKLMPPLEGKEEDRRIGIDTGVKVQVANDIKKFSWSNLNLQYYVDEAKKLIASVEGA